MTIKELQNNEELLNSVVEDIDDIPEDSVVTYEVWAIGYDKDDAVTDAETYFGEFVDYNDAIKVAEKLTLADIIHTAAEDYDGSTPADVAYISIEVETVVEDEDGEIMNIGTIYNREIWIGESDSEEDDEDDCEIITLMTGEYEVLEDNTLKVSCKALQGVNKNDIVMFNFGPDSFPMEYKIMSKVIYEDGDYYHCELVY